MFGGMTANGSHYILVYAERYILHEHSMCVTVLTGNDR
jgi:hypothetical protein